MYNLKTFFDNARPLMNGGLLTELQVKGIELIIKKAEKYNLSTSHLAYVLATVKRETGDTFQPIKEWGRGNGRQYGKPHPKTGQTYYGRGFVQLTWLANYQLAADKLGINSVNDPDVVMQPDISAEILIQGMVEGWFTNKKLADYITTGTLEEYKEARRIVNGMDKSALIADYAMQFKAALEAAEVVNDTPLTKSRTVGGAGTAAGGGAVILIEPIKEATEVFTEQQEAMSSGSLVTLVLGSIIVLGALYALYARWDDAGRPKFWK